MADLKASLSALGFYDYSTLPTTDDDLTAFISEACQHAEFLANTIPIGPDHHASDTPRATSPPAASDEDLSRTHASKASETMHTSSTSLPLIPERSRKEEFYKLWGKPLKLSAKENPLEVSVYKMSATDKKGAWFARRSVHEGIGFTKFRRCMQREFMVSLAVKEGPGTGAVRGIAADKRLAKRSVEGAGKIEVWQLSAKFGPVTPREFCTMAISSTNALSAASAPADKPTDIPRHYINISRPSAHPEATKRDGLVHGSYESIEMIREIPGSARTPDDPETNLVEWIMVTRSDPGGGIPRFMVERGTPGSIVGDVSKFLNWACDADNDPASCDEDEEETEIQRMQSLHKDSAAPAADEEQTRQQQRNERAVSAVDPVQAPTHDAGGTWFATIGHAVESAVSGVIPYLPYGKMRHDDAASASPSSDTDDEDDAESVSSFTSASQHRHGISRHHTHEDTASSTTLAADRASSPRPSTETKSSEAKSSDNKSLSAHDRELAKLAKKRADLDARIAAARTKEASRSQTALESADSERARHADKFSKELAKSEERYKRELAKLEARQDKEARKVEERRAKALEKDRVAALGQEVKDWREKHALAVKEGELLTKNLEALQRENAALAAALGEVEGGRESVDFVRKGGSVDGVVERMRAKSVSQKSPEATS